MVSFVYRVYGESNQKFDEFKTTFSKSILCKKLIMYSHSNLMYKG